jgi:hypothetical protein
MILRSSASAFLSSPSQPFHQNGLERTPTRLYAWSETTVAAVRHIRLPHATTPILKVTGHGWTLRPQAQLAAGINKKYGRKSSVCRPTACCSLIAYSSAAGRYKKMAIKSARAVKKSTLTRTKVAAKSTSAAKAGEGAVYGWEDDPASMPVPTPVQRPLPAMGAGPLKFAIAGTHPKSGLYPRGSSAFRFWATAEALQRACDYWSKIIPSSARWQVGASLPVHTDVGVDLNAFYSRGDAGDQPGLNFFHATVDGVTYYSGESPEIACHEFGHAVLDAIRPELFNASFAEVAAFHESFGDMSAIMSVLQLPSMRADVIAATSGTIYAASRVSRLAEQLGSAIRVSYPDAVDPDCLRNAVNSFFYRDPQGLPSQAPASHLSSESHSFSRIFTSAFFELLGGIFRLQPGSKDEARLLDSCIVAGKLLVGAVSSASVVPAYYSQVAGQFLNVDAAMFNGAYRSVITRAFVRRGILSLEAATTPASPRRAVLAATKSLTQGTMQTRQAVIVLQAPVRFGATRPLYVEGGAGEVHLAVASAGPTGIAAPPSQAAAADAYVEDLFQRGRIIVGKHAEPTLEPPFSRKTHQLVEYDDGAKLQRIRFHCGFGDENWGIDSSE